VPIKGALATQLVASLPQLRHLRFFSLKKDMTPVILEQLVATCGELLLLLDMEESKGVGDQELETLYRCTSLQELNICGTRISAEGKARVIMRLPRLRHLVRGDFLCDALGWIEYLEEVEEPLYDLQEFTPSQSYFFHETWQMEMVGRMCPNLSKILFIQHPDSCPSVDLLKIFGHLTDLQLHGVPWEGGGLQDLLEGVGQQLHHLGLISCKVPTPTCPGPLPTCPGPHLPPLPSPLRPCPQQLPAVLGPLVLGLLVPRPRAPPGGGGLHLHRRPRLRLLARGGGTEAQGPPPGQLHQGDGLHLPGPGVPGGPRTPGGAPGGAVRLPQSGDPRCSY